MGYYVPEALKNRPNWLVWRFVDVGNTKPSKVPYSPKTGHRARFTDSKQLASYEEAINYFQYGGEFDGIGFVFTAEDDFVFIDLDNCISEAGEISAHAAELIELFKETYIELSQSEKGLHIVCKGKFPKTVKKKEIEIYPGVHYMAFTGNAINTVEPTEQQPALNALFSRYAPQTIQEPKERPKRAKTGNIEDIMTVIRASKQGEKFEALHNGKWNQYRSQSEADQAYINIVNHFTGGNDNITIAIWQASELSKRPKGKRRDYIQGMIKNAKTTATECHTGGYKRARATTKEIDTAPIKRRARKRI